MQGRRCVQTVYYIILVPMVYLAFAVFIVGNRERAANQVVEQAEGRVLGRVSGWC